MNENQSNAKNLIDGLLQEAENNPDFEQWKKDHPEEIARHAAMSKEEIIAEIMESLEKLGYIKPDEEQPEPEQELTTEEAEALYNNMTDEEEKDFIEHCVFCGGFEKVANEVQVGQHKKRDRQDHKIFLYSR